ncbi:MAG: hypothetical protein PHD36_05345 [Desulfotomaculaceae bacterium]|nr:hypothetical protein [Desulfotomaculaceae bacterium]
MNRLIAGYPGSVKILGQDERILVRPGFGNHPGLLVIYHTS